MDRASGSGVFARDPDALLDMIELELSEDVLKQEENKAVCEACRQYLDVHFRWHDDLSLDDLCSSRQMLNYCENKLNKEQWEALKRSLDRVREKARALTAWRIEGTLREFPKFQPVNVWFRYPVHQMDTVGVLSDIQPDTDKPSWQRAIEKRKPKDQKAKERKESIMAAYEACGINETVTVGDLAEYLGVSEKTVRSRLKEHGGFAVEDGKVRKKT